MRCDDNDADVIGARFSAASAQHQSLAVGGRGFDQSTFTEAE